MRKVIFALLVALVAVVAVAAPRPQPPAATELYVIRDGERQISCSCPEAKPQPQPAPGPYVLLDGDPAGSQTIHGDSTLDPFYAARVSISDFWINLRSGIFGAENSAVQIGPDRVDLSVPRTDGSGSVLYLREASAGGVTIGSGGAMLLSAERLQLISYGAVPTSSADPCVVGQTAFDDDYIYRCTSNGWGRAALEVGW